jgi:membrane protein YdbS with pleckstrin-like domain
MPLVDTESAFTSSNEGDNWVAVSPKLVTARRLVLAVGLLPFTTVVIIVLLWLGAAPTIPIIAAAAATVIFIWAWWLIGRRVRSYAYCERGDDLLVSSGILFRRLVIVPYGRMQLVDVKAGPIDRAFGVTTVQLHTAAATTDAAIPGLEPNIAADLRDRLARKGETRSAGL